MTPIFDGLYLGEVVLLVLGSILFVVLLIALLYQLMHKGSIAPLLAFFAVSITMIGYPSIKEIQFKDGLVTITKMTEEVQQNPTDANLRKKLQKQVEQISQRPVSTPESAVAVALAQFELGNEEAAKSNLQKALQANPNTPAKREAQELQKKIIVFDNLKQIASQVEANPNDNTAKTKLASTLAQASQLKTASPAALIQVARAQAALGEHAKALENTQKVLSIEPGSQAATQLQNAVKARIAAGPH